MPPISASLTNNLSDRKVKHDFYPSNFTFEYSTGNTTTYQGDLGLQYGYCKNKADNKTYALEVDTVRGIAYATKNTFKFKENLDCNYATYGNPEKTFIYHIYYKNGTEIQKLSIRDDDLTLEQRSYFQDYDSQKEAEYQRQENLRASSEADDNAKLIKLSSEKKTTTGYGFTSNGHGFTYRSTTK